MKLITDKLQSFCLSSFQTLFSILGIFLILFFLLFGRYNAVDHDELIK